MMQAWDAPYTTHNSRDDNPESDHVITRAGVATAHARQERPVFIPTSQDWGHSHERHNKQNEDYDWRRRKKNSHYTEEAVFDKNWPKPRTRDKHDTCINKQHRTDKSVPRQISKKADGHQIVDNMNNSSRARLQARHLPEWIPIRNIPDVESQRLPHQRPDVTIIRGQPSDGIVLTPPVDDIVIR